jgi:hypothetical protein
MSETSEVTVDPPAPGSTPVTVFVSDPTAEAERVAQAMRAAGYTVVDVPLSMLVARVAVQHPRVILVDADGEGALEVIVRIRELPDAEEIHVLLLALPGGAVASEEEALAHEASGLFVRPVDAPELVRRVGVLAGGGVPARPQESDSAPLHGVSEATIHRSSVPPASTRTPPAGPSTGADVVRDPSNSPVGPPRQSSERPLSRRLPALAPPISLELGQLLADAERRVSVGEDAEDMAPSPEDEIEAILPADLLASLDEPLEEEEDDLGPVARVPSVSSPEDGPSSEPPTSVPAQPLTHSGTHSWSTGEGSATGGNSQVGSAPATGPAPSAAAATSGLPPSAPPPTAWSVDRVQPPGEAGALPEPASLPEHPDAHFPAVVGPGETLGVLARAVAGHVTGSLCFAANNGERRVVLREGDIATAVSNSDDESLLAFLATRGDLPRETVRRLAATFPLFGRHAGAALVARGYLRQDQLWPTLRAHAEWVLARAVQSASARLVVEQQPSGRLQGEPSVFGGSPGAAVLVDVARRVVAPGDALERMGGRGSRIEPGPAARLLGECALAPAELSQVQSAGGCSLGEALDAAPEGDLATLLFALSQLGVIEVLRAVGDRAAVDPERDPAGVAALDAEAIRERVRARIQLVDDADYFALLGVTRDATGYEVRRAFLDLRRAFEPSRVLTPETADLADDMRKITFVLEEAYEILKDAARRERYRRAIEAVPGR